MLENKLSLLTAEKEIYGSFVLNDSEFALSVSYIQEVINPPEVYTSVPLSPPCMLGLLNLRGCVLPVLDLKKLLSLSASTKKEDQKIAILEINGSCIGLLIDQTGEVFKGELHEKSSFNNPDGVITGAFKMQDGNRLIQVIDVPALFRIQNIPKECELNRDIQKKRNPKGHRHQAISFIVGESKCALKINEIQEILKINHITEKVLCGKSCIGAINLRGSVVPLIDFAAVMGLRSPIEDLADAPASQRVIVMRMGVGLFGLLVDSVDTIMSFYEEDIISFPVLNQERKDLFLGAIASQNGGGDIILLDSTKIFSNTEVEEITRGHSNLFKTATMNERVKEVGERRTYILFSVEHEYGIKIEEVKEIIDCPANLMHPPGLSSHYAGVLNLRGEMVMIVDAGQLYFDKPILKQANTKVLIFKKDQLHFGLIVDAVGSILSLHDKDKVELPSILFKNTVGRSAVDIIEAMQFKDSNNQNCSILVLDSSLLADRITNLSEAA